MSDTDRILIEFMQAWEAGRLPEPDAYLERVPPEQRHALSKDIQAYLMVAPEPEYDEATWAALASSPSPRAAATCPSGSPSHGPPCCRGCDRARA